MLDWAKTVSSPTVSKAIHQGHGSTQPAHSPVCVNMERAPTGRPAVFGSIFVITMDEETLILLVLIIYYYLKTKKVVSYSLK
jgi:hypothetical protein